VEDAAMKLRYAPTSPYVRKVTVLALETGQNGKIERLATTSPPDKPNLELGRENPLNKVPCLLTDDGLVLYDSPVICEYLDAQHNGRKWFPAGTQRWHALRQMALADGILDAALLRRYEGLRPESERSGNWDKAQKLKIDQALDALEHEVASFPDPAGDQLSIGHVSIGCALGYLDFRFAKEDWRKGRPKLARWNDGLSKRPSMAQTVPAG
jgi:glutathione S-transferase